jgi:glycosyltransferase involved in cell wall biosynthesis
VFTAGVRSGLRGHRIEVASDEPIKTAEPLVSVIIPTHNYGALIGETLKSLRCQTLAQWECIVVDDGSTDDTAEVVAEAARLDPRFRYVWQANQRQAVAKNTGLASARGKYVQFLDADDLIEPQKLERQVAYLEAHREVDIVYGDVRYFRAGRPDERLLSMGGGDAPRTPKVSGEGREVLEAFVRGNIVVINAPLVRRRVAEEVGPFDPVLPPAEDWDYWLRCALAGARFQFMDEPGTLALVRVHSTSSSQDRVRMYTAGLLIRRKLAESVKDGSLRVVNRELRARDELDLAVAVSERGDSLSAARHLFGSARYERRWRWRAKLTACALAAPVVSGTRLRALLFTSLMGSAKSLLHKGEAA